jgi:hypothetical protein
MAIHAADAVPAQVYRPTRNQFFDNAYYKLHRWSVETLIRRLEKKGLRANGREKGLLATAMRHPDWPLFVWYLRGTTLFGERWEIKTPMLLPPDTRLRAVKTKPRYR